MNKKFTKLMAALALLVFMAPNMVGWGQTRDEVVAYTLTPASGSNNSYAGNCDITINGITWNLTGNSTYQPWRIGGKSISDTDRPLYSKTAIADNITKIEVTHGEASSITVNSWTVIVASDADFTSVVSTLTPTFEASTTTTITRPVGADWTDCYYKFVYNVTVSGSSNKFLQFTEAKFYKETAATYTLTDYSGEHGSISFNPASPVSAGTHVTLTPTPVSAYYFVDNSWSFFDDDLENVTEDIEFVEGEPNTIVMPAYNLLVDATFSLKPTYGIICAVNNAEWGTLEASPTTAYEGQTVTLSYSAETGYRLSSIAITKTEDGNATGITPVESGDDFTFEMPAYAVTATATFEAIPTYTITFNPGNGTCETESWSGLDGSTITLPTADPSQACASRGWEFAGWATASVSETTTSAPTLYNGTYTITANVDLYAVYTVEEEGNSPTAFSVGNTGTYAIVSEKQDDKYYALPTNPTVSSGKITAQEITVSEMDGVKYIATSDASGFAWTIASATNGYTLYDGNNYIYHSNGGSSGTNLTYGNNTSYTWNLSVRDTDYIQMAAMSGSTTNNRGMLFSGTNIGGYSLNNWGANDYYRTMILPIADATVAIYATLPDCLEKVATPVITLAEGTYTEVKTTTITCATEGATIYYTTDGTDPTDESTEYTGAITIGQSMTLKAIAVKEGMDNSNIASATYTINIQYTLTINNENGNIRDIHVFDDPSGNEAILYIDDINGEKLTETIDAGTTIYVSVGGVVDCMVFDALTVTCGGSAVATTYDPDNDMYYFTLNGNTSIAVSATDAEEYTLTVAGLEHVSFDLLVGSESDITSLNANHQATICEQVLIEVTDLTVGNGKVLESVTLTYGDETQTITLEYGVYAFNMPSSDATLTITTSIATSFFERYSGELTEGDYLIVYDGKAMNTTVSSDRLQYEEVTPYNNGDVIATNDNGAIVWHIAQSGDYWTIYNEEANAYAASTGAKNKAQMLDDGTDDKAMWTVSGTSTYEFVNKYNNNQSVNAYLRNNGIYGFACYASNYGNVPSLYKKVTPQDYTTMDIQPNQWYFIASPTGTSPVNVNVLSDLYYYDEKDHHWRNQKVFANAEGFVNFDLGKGYLCANTGESAVTLTFTGVAITDDYSVALDYNATTTEGETNNLAGWNLVGNPFTSDAYIERNYYVIGIDTETGKSIIVASEGGAIAPCTGVMVQAEGEEESVTFTTNAPANPSNGNLQMTVAKQVVTRDGVSTGLTTIDNAIVSFNEGSRLGKFYFGENDANIYIPQNGKEYAIVSAEAQGEMPVNFRAANNGTYTLSINPEGVEMNYLHLIDNMTGADVDLLAATSTGSVASYTFNAKTTDYESRFRLVFAAGASTGSATDATFAFFANGELIVSNEGEATLQVVDMTGRILSSQSLNGNGSVQMAAPVGVYVLRLISGNEVKTQKIVVR